MTKTFLQILFIAFIINSLNAQQQGFGCIDNMQLLSTKGTLKFQPKTEPITKSFPLFGKKASENNRTHPLPFGVGINSLYYNQKYNASNLYLTTDSSNIRARADSLYQNTTAYELKASVRPNFWLFPFLNIYGIIGYTKGVISPNLTIPYVIIENIPVIDSLRVDTSFSITDEIGYVGPTYGVGATLSKGFRYWFIMADYNYSVTDPTDLDDNLKNHFFSPKIGVFLGKQNKNVFGAIWLGAMYIYNDQSFTGKVNVNDINPNFVPLFGEEATYSGSITANSRWNFIIGGSFVIKFKHHITIEAGYFERKQISIGYDFRF